MLTSYLTVKSEGSDQYIIQKSRFIGYVKRVETETLAQEFIQKVKKKHYDATHNCSAYIVGENQQIQKANDDGEPGGTAGIPILEVLKKQNLVDTAVVITRYFGGVKLGAGGLIRAYGHTTSKALKSTGIVKRQLMQGISITIDYPLLGKLENELRNSEHIIDKINYLNQVEFIVFVMKGKEVAFKEWIVNITSDQAVFSDAKLAYVEINVKNS